MRCPSLLRSCPLFTPQGTTPPQLQVPADQVRKCVHGESGRGQLLLALAEGSEFKPSILGGKWLYLLSHPSHLLTGRKSELLLDQRVSILSFSFPSVAVGLGTSCFLFWSEWSTKYDGRGREMAQRLRALAALPEHLGSIPSTHVTAHNYL